MTKVTNLDEQISQAFNRLHPYAGTVREVFSDADLTKRETLDALSLISLDCPWFSKVLYMRACYALGQVVTRRTSK